MRKNRVLYFESLKSNLYSRGFYRPIVKAARSRGLASLLLFAVAALSLFSWPTGAVAGKSSSFSGSSRSSFSSSRSPSSSGSKSSFSGSSSFTSSGKSSVSTPKSSGFSGFAGKSNYTAPTKPASSFASGSGKASYQDYLSKIAGNAGSAASKPFSMENLRTHADYTRRLDRRDVYSSYRPPSYVQPYDSLSSGSFNPMFWWFLIDEIGDAAMVYNHSNDPSYIEWRHHADEAAKENAELRTKLDTLDAKMRDMQTGGKTKDPAYMTPGLAPEVAVREDIDRTRLPKIRLCTGSGMSNYHKMGGLLAQKAQMNVDLVPSLGSMDNLNKMVAGECDAAIVQDDVLKSHADAGVRKVALITYEPLLLFCRQGSGEDTILVGDDQTGSQETLKNLQEFSDRFRKAGVEHRQTAIVAAQSLLNGEGGCLFMVTSPDAAVTKMLDDAGTVRMREIPRGKGLEIYREGVVNAGRYKNLIDGAIWKDNETLVVPTSFVVSSRWSAANQEAFDLISMEGAGLREIAAGRK